MLTLAGQSVSTLEMVAFATGLLSVWLTQRMHVANWPAGLVNVACFSVLFVEAKLYADALLQVAFFVLGVYGWWSWSHAAAGTQRQLAVTCASAAELGWLAVIAIAGTWGVARTLVAFTDSPVPLPDAAVLVLSLLATWAQAKRRLECWLLWIAVDLISIPLYWSRSLHLTALLYVVFLLICIAGLWNWKARLTPARATA